MKLAECRTDNPLFHIEPEGAEMEKLDAYDFVEAMPPEIKAEQLRELDDDDLTTLANYLLGHGSVAQKDALADVFWGKIMEMHDNAHQGVEPWAFKEIDNE